MYFNHSFINVHIFLGLILAQDLGVGLDLVRGLAAHVLVHVTGRDALDRDPDVDVIVLGSKYFQFKHELKYLNLKLFLLFFSDLVPVTVVAILVDLDHEERAHVPKETGPETKIKKGKPKKKIEARKKRRKLLR